MPLAPPTLLLLLLAIADAIAADAPPLPIVLLSEGPPARLYYCTAGFIWLTGIAELIEGYVRSGFTREFCAKFKEMLLYAKELLWELEMLFTPL